MDRVRKTRIHVGVKAGIGMFAVLLGIQLIPVERTNPPNGFEVAAPPEVAEILERACYNCHSNRTSWPWYSRIAPASWLVARHVSHGREELNFTDWPTMDLEEEAYLLGLIPDEMESESMPPRSYLLLHPEAQLTAEERGILSTWADRAAVVTESDLGF